MKNVRKILGFIFFGGVGCLLLFGYLYPKPEHIKTTFQIECEQIGGTTTEIGNCIHEKEWISDMEQVIKRLKAQR